MERDHVEDTGIDERITRWSVDTQDAQSGLD